MQNKTIKKKLVLKKNIRRIINQTLLAIIITLISLIAVKKEPNLKNILIENVYEKSFKFTKARELYKKYFGSLIPIEKILKEEKPVFNEKLSYTSKNAYKDGVALKVTDNYLVPALESCFYW